MHLANVLTLLPFPPSVTSAQLTALVRVLDACVDCSALDMCQDAANPTYHPCIPYGQLTASLNPKRLVLPPTYPRPADETETPAPSQPPLPWNPGAGIGGSCQGLVAVCAGLDRSDQSPILLVVEQHSARAAWVKESGVPLPVVRAFNAAVLKHRHRSNEDRVRAELAAKQAARIEAERASENAFSRTHTAVANAVAVAVSQLAAEKARIEAAAHEAEAVEAAAARERSSALQAEMWRLKGAKGPHMNPVASQEYRDQSFVSPDEFASNDGVDHDKKTQASAATPPLRSFPPVPNGMSGDSWRRAVASAIAAAAADVVISWEGASAAFAVGCASETAAAIELKRPPVTVRMNRRCSERHNPEIVLTF